MSEIYKRSLGYTYNEDALRREVDAGMAGYDVTAPEIITDDLTVEVRELSRVEQLQAELMEWHMYEAVNGGLDEDDRIQVVMIETEIVFREYEERMSELAVEHPRYSGHVGKILTDRLDALAAFGHPVDPEMYVEAQELAEEIVAANPDKDAEELSRIVETMVGMIQAEYRLRQYSLVA
jgi:hypothetical protein